MLRDLDSGLVSRCSGLWIVGIEFEQEVAAEAMQEGVRVVLPALLGRRQTFVDRRQRTLGVARRDFKFCEKSQERRHQ